MTRDLSGHWSGLYRYGGPAASWPSVPFSALLEVEDGLLGGWTEEANTFAPSGPAILRATIAGEVTGSGISFAKTYDLRLPQTDIVHYDGTLSRDGSRIDGTWRFLHHADGQGSFTLRRLPGLTAARRAVAQAGR